MKRTTSVTLIPSTGLLLTFGLGLSAFAAGPVFIVNSFADVADTAPNGTCETAPGNGICTLRAAVMEANGGPHDHLQQVIIKLQAGLYKLTEPVAAPDDARNGDLNIFHTVRLEGAGMELTTIDGNGVDRVIFVHPSANVQIADMTIQGGRPSSALGRVTYGGGILVHQGNFTLIRSLVRANQTGPGEGGGGGIYVTSGSLSGVGSLALAWSMVRANTASFGGGILAIGVPVGIKASSIYANATSGQGGGLYLSDVTLTAWNSTISGNHAAADGGGIQMYECTAKLNSVTMVDNHADSDLDSSGHGGAIDVGYMSTVVISNSIFENASGRGLMDFSCLSPSVTSNGYNRVNAPNGCITGAFQSGYVDVASIAFNGGLTATQMPLGTFGIDLGDPNGCVDTLGAPLTTDQRGVLRPIGSRCDLGAVEVEPIGDVNGDGLVNVSDVLFLINHLFAGGPTPIGRANVNNDSDINVSDLLYLVNYLFAGGPAPVD